MPGVCELEILKPFNKVFSNFESVESSHNLEKLYSTKRCDINFANILRSQKLWKNFVSGVHATHNDKKNISTKKTQMGLKKEKFHHVSVSVNTV